MTTDTETASIADPDFFTYMYHPESDSYLAVQNKELDAFYETPDGALCSETTLAKFLESVDSGKCIPKDVKGILKNATWADAPYPPETIVGDLWYNPQGQFPDGVRIYTSRITDIRSDGIYCSLHTKYFVQFTPGCEKRTRFV